MDLSHKSFSNAVVSNSRRTFPKLQFVENGSLSGGVKTDHQDTHLLLAELYSWKKQQK